jgi:tryptophan synthase alpha chain
MGRIGQAFEKARSENRAALVTYLCAGDPSLDATVALVLAAAEAGADVIELGVPFSDPTADGAAIQRAAERSLKHGTTLAKVLEVAAKVRERSQVPLLLFGYYNPILAYGEARLVKDAKEKGVDGFLVVDLPPEESGDFAGAVKRAGLDYVPLVAPTTSSMRTELIGDVASSFIYYVSMTGVTGAAQSDLAAARDRARSIEAQLGRPVAVGFGVKTPDDVRGLARDVSGVVVGSALVETVERAADAGAAVLALGAQVRGLRAATQRGA